MASSSTLHRKLDELYNILQKLRSTSSEEAFDELGAFFDESCSAWLLSMREWAEPSIGRESIISTAKQNLQTCHLDERRVLSRSAADDGVTIVCEMKNRLIVLGRSLDPFYETVVVKFNERGLITDFKLYSCRSHIVMIVQEVTGVGPYNSETAKGGHT